MAAANGDFTVQRDNKYRVAGWIWPFDITGDEIELTVKHGDEVILVKSTEDEDNPLVLEEITIETVVYPVVYWDISKAESLLIPLGRVVSYRVERKVDGGEERTYISGYIIGTDGV